MKMNTILSPIIRIIDDTYWEVMEDFSYTLNNKFTITVPKGFKTNLASSPRPLWFAISPSGKHNAAAVVHDWLYSEYNDTGINRTLADKIFYRIMLECGVNKIKAKLMYYAVRNFGSVCWQHKIKNEGYQDQAIFDKTKEAIEYYGRMRDILGVV